MKTKATLLLAAILAAGSAAADPGEQANPRNPNDSRAFDVMDTDQGPPTATDRLYAKPKHKKHSKKHRSAETEPYDASSMGASGTTGVTGSGTELQTPPPVSNELRNDVRNDVRTQPDRELAPDQPRTER